MGWLPVLEWGGCQYWNGVGTNVGMGWIPISGWGGERDKTKKGNQQKLSYRRIKLSKPNNKQVSQTIQLRNFVMYTTLRLRYIGKENMRRDNKGWI